MPSDTFGKLTLALMSLLGFLAAAHHCDICVPSHRVKTHSEVPPGLYGVLGFFPLYAELLSGSEWMGWFMGYVFF